MSLPNVRQQIGSNFSVSLGENVTLYFKAEVVKNSILTNGGYYNIVNSAQILNNSGQDYLGWGWLSYIATTQLGSIKNVNKFGGTSISSGDELTTSTLIKIPVTEGSTLSDDNWMELPLESTDANKVYLPLSNYSYNTSYTFEGAWAIYGASGVSSQITIESTQSGTITTFPPSPNIQIPTQVNPYNRAVDIDKPLDFNFVFSGEKLTGYNIKVKNQTNNTIVFESGIQDLRNSPVYNGKSVRYSSYITQTHDDISITNMNEWKSMAGRLLDSLETKQVSYTISGLPENTTFLVQLKDEQTAEIETKSHRTGNGSYTDNFNFNGAGYLEICVIGTEDAPINVPINVSVQNIKTPISQTEAMDMQQLNWTIDLYGDTGNFSDMCFLTTTPYYFEAYFTPHYSLLFNGTAIINNTYTLTQKNLNITGTYTQGQNIPLKCYQIQVYQMQESVVGDLLYDSDKIFSSEIKYEYSGMLPLNNYMVKFSGENTKGQTYTLQVQITVEYSVETTYNGAMVFNPENQRVELDWAKGVYTVPTYPQGATFLYENSQLQESGSTDNKSIIIPNNSWLKYDNISGVPFEQMTGEDALAMRVRITENTTTISTIKADNVVYKFYLVLDSEGKHIYVDQISQRFTNNVNTYKIFTFTTEVKFALQNNNSTPNSNSYLWYSDSEHEWVSDNSHYFLTDKLDATILIIMNFSEDIPAAIAAISVVDQTPDVQHTTYSTTYKGASTDTTQYDNGIVFNGNTKIDSIVYQSTPFTSSQLGLIESPQYNWSDFENAEILCNFTNSYISKKNIDIASEVNGYKIFRQKYGFGYDEQIGDISVDDLNNYCSYVASDGQTHYKIYDYSCGNNITYSYKIYPYTAGTAVIPAKFQSPITLKSNNEDYLFTDCHLYSLIPLIHNNKKKYSIYSNYFSNSVNQSEGDKFYDVWIFTCGLQEDTITQNQNKTLYTGFSATPKISISPLNYDTGSFSAYLGDVLCQDEPTPNMIGQPTTGVVTQDQKYYEPLYLLTRWKDFVGDNNICLYKNPKGETKIVSIDANSTRSYNNNISNFYIRDRQATAYPTTISFNYTEIDKIQDSDIKIEILK